MVRFIIALTTVTVTVIGLAYLALSRGFIEALPSFFYPTIILTLIVTAVIYKYLSNLKDPSLFTQFYLLSMVVKLLAFLGYNILIVLEDREGATENVVFFLLLYVIFTAVEIVFLYRIVTSKTPPETRGKNF